MDPYNVADANAYKLAPKYTDAGMLESIFHQYPGLHSVYSNNNFDVHNVTPERRHLGEGIIDNRYSEFYFPKDIGGLGQNMLPRPKSSELNNFSLEYYNPDAINNSDIRRSLTVNEMLHGMAADPKWNQMRQKLFSDFSPQINNVLQNQFKSGIFGNEGGNESFNHALNRTIGDQYLRASFFQNPQSENNLNPPSYAPKGDYWNKNEFLNQLSPQQNNDLSAMHRYLTQK